LGGILTATIAARRGLLLIAAPEFAGTSVPVVRQLRFAICVKSLGCFRLSLGFFASRVDRWHTAFGRGKHYLNALISEDVIGRREFLQPDAGFLAGFT
jgi:hypothetical protein